MRDYEDIRELARETGLTTKDLIVLSPQNDPFYAGVPARRERAEWFAALWGAYGFPPGAHIRRIHYVFVSQPVPILWPNGEPYENTQNDWQGLVNASLGARYLGLIPDGVLVDRRNPAPLIRAVFQDDPDPVVRILGASIDLELPDEFPVPELFLQDFHQNQNYLVEVWAEKSTMNDVLDPLSRRLGFNLITGIGEMSETACREAVERAVDARKPMRILYVSDFDPAGRSMPVAVARKIQHRLYAAGIEADITLQPIILNEDQCMEYNLPRTPIKETEKRAAQFESRFGAGATELDALEALHPGALAEIVENEVCRYFDPTLTNRIHNARREIYGMIRDLENRVREHYATEIEGLSEQYDELLNDASIIEEEAQDLWARMEKDLQRNKPGRPEVDVSMIPVPRDPNPTDNPLFDSTRDEFSQLDRYHEFQGK